jgi:hypothetical protein
MSWALAFILLAVIIAILVVTGIGDILTFIGCALARIGIGVAVVLAGRRREIDIRL